jgi:hypothetical protein
MQKNNMDRITSCKIIKFCQTPLLLLLNTGNDMKPENEDFIMDCLTAAFIGVGLAVLLVAWWSS